MQRSHRFSLSIAVYDLKWLIFDLVTVIHSKLIKQNVIFMLSVFI